MKILFWTDGYWPRLGGIETYSFQLLNGLQERGHQFMVAAQKDNANWKEHEIYHNVPIRRFDFNALIAKKDLQILRSIQEYVEDVTREFQPDIIHLNATIGGSAFAFSLFMKMFKVPIVLTAYAPYLHENKLPPIIEKIASYVDQIVCISNWVLKEMEKHLPTFKDKLRLIYCGLPLPNVALLPLTFSPPTLLLFGRLSWEKGFDQAIRAFALLKDRGSNARAIVAGSGPERASLEKLVEELGLNHSVKFTGPLSKEEVLSTFNQATLVIVPSILESFGLVILEAMQFQRPVISYNTQGIPEVISDGETGVLVPAQDHVALAEAIQDLLNHPEKAIKMGIQGRKRAMEKFTLDQKVCHYENLYNELVGVNK